MKEAVFRRRYEPLWAELEELLKRRGKRRDAARLGKLYRETTGHLSFARTYFPDLDVTAYLNGLVGRAHSFLYGKSEGQWMDVGRFFAVEFPAAVRRNIAFFAVSWGIMLVGMVVGFVTVLRSTSALYALLPASFVQGFNPMQAGPHAVDQPLMASLIMTHNIFVTFQAFIGAFTLGLLTMWALYYNGLLLGALAALFLRSHRSLIFWSLILPHGFTELTAIAVAGGAGLLVGYRLIVPGIFTRAESLRRSAADGARMLAGVMTMLVIAGTIEGFLTPSHLSLAFKYVFAFATALAWVIYFTFAGRRRTANQVRM